MADTLWLYHYYNRDFGPFRNLSDLDDAQAQAVLADIRRTKPDSFCARRSDEYMELRRHFETILREEFCKKGGKPQRTAPHYMTLGHSPWLSTWYENCGVIKIPVAEFDLSTLSFTYGDSHPTFSDRVNDGKEYRKKLYLYDEILNVIDKYGMPQEWNDDGRFGPERYIEAHIWSDEVIDRYRRDAMQTIK